MYALLEKQTHELDADDVSALADWLRALEDDCRIFGATASDKTTMFRIKARLAAAQST